jgi:hypothetical protein
MKRVMWIAVWLLCLGIPFGSRADLAILGQFNPSNAADLCGIGFDPTSGQLWVYGCSESTVQRYSSAGSFLSSVARPGESANDVDVELAPTAFNFASTAVSQGSLLFINGETGVAEIYAVDKSTGSSLGTLITSFGVSHVVGGAYHPGRASLFLIQDQVPPAADRNRVAEIDPVSGLVLNTFQTTPSFAVNFGDLEVCGSSQNLLVVSSSQTSIGEFTPTGSFVQTHALPAGVSSLSGIGIDDATGEIWVSGTGGVVWRLGGGPCAATPTAVPALPNMSLIATALLLVGSAYLVNSRRKERRG